MTAPLTLTAATPASPALQAMAEVEAGQTPSCSRGLHTFHEWQVACRHARADGYLYELELMIEREADYTGANRLCDDDTPGPLFDWWPGGDAAPDLTRAAMSYVPGRVA